MSAEKLTHDEIMVIGTALTKEQLKPLLDWVETPSNWEYDKSGRMTEIWFDRVFPFIYQTYPDMPWQVQHHLAGHCVNHEYYLQWPALQWIKEAVKKAKKRNIVEGKANRIAALEGKIASWETNLSRAKEKLAKMKAA